MPLADPGVVVVLAEKLPGWKKHYPDSSIIANVGFSNQEYATVAGKISLATNVNYRAQYLLPNIDKCWPFDWSSSRVGLRSNKAAVETSAVPVYTSN